MAAFVYVRRKTSNPALSQVPAQGRPRVSLDLAAEDRVVAAQDRKSGHIESQVSTRTKHPSQFAQRLRRLFVVKCIDHVERRSEIEGVVRKGREGQCAGNQALALASGVCQAAEGEVDSGCPAVTAQHPQVVPSRTRSRGCGDRCAGRSTGEQRGDEATKTAKPKCSRSARAVASRSLSISNALKLTVCTADGSSQLIRQHEYGGEGAQTRAALLEVIFDETQLSSVGYGRDHHDRVDGRRMRQKKPAAPVPPPAPAPAPPAPEPTKPTPPPAPAPAAPAAPKTPTEDEVFAAMSLDDLNKKAVLTDTFFALDSTELGPESRSSIQKNGEYMKRWSSTKVLVEGHADSRGTNEDNLALAERRAAAVRDYLVGLGVTANG